MDRSEFELAMQYSPVLVRMNDGRAYEVRSKEFVTVSEIAASVLYQHEDGKMRHVYLPLVTMSAVEPIPQAV